MVGWWLTPLSTMKTMKNITDLRRFDALDAFAEKHRDETGDSQPLLVLMSAADNAIDSGFQPGTEEFAYHALLSLCEFICPRGDYRHLVPLFQSWGFLA